MSAKRITIIVDEDGNAQLEGHGFIGAECDRAMQEDQPGPW